MKPLALFLDPPLGAWTLLHGFAPAAANANSTEARYQSNGPENVYAASSGDLSVMRGGWHRFTAPTWFDPFTFPIDGDDPEVVDLFLELDAAAGLNSVFWAKIVEHGIVRGFVYRNILVSSLEAALAELLDQATLPPSGSRQSTVDMLVRNLIKVNVPVGHAIGIPGRAPTSQIPFDTREFAFGVYNYAGPLDPSAFYDSMREFVDDASTDIDAFVALTPKHWPLIPDQAPFATALTQASAMLLPYSALTRYRDTAALTYAEFRQLGDAQKQLYREQLHYRFDVRLPNSSEPPFSFNDADTTNLFQLEAIAEFFLNFTEPMLPGAVPRVPSLGSLSGNGATANGHWVSLSGVSSSDFAKIVANEHFLYLPGSVVKPSRTFRIVDLDPALLAVFVHQTPDLTSPSDWSIDLYKRVNFLDPAGVVAAIAGSVITLGGTPDLRDVWPGHDMIRLTGAVEGVQHLTVTSIDPVAGTVTTDHPPFASATAWKIITTPKLVLIDPFGSRPNLSSDRGTALRATVHAGQNRVALGDAAAGNYPRLTKINIDQYDSVYFEADLARARKTYRIVAVASQTVGSEQVRNILELDGQPDFGMGGSSPYAIPAGVGGDLEVIGNSQLGPDASNGLTFIHGWDHYDGALFLIYGDEVKPPWRWSSYTSRKELLPSGTVSWRSSMRGNKEYEYYSIRASNAFRNFSFNVVDIYESNDPLYIGVSEARHYFERLTDGTVKTDSSKPGDLPDPYSLGKTACFLHRGNINGTGNASGGCLVSPLYHQLLHTLADIEIDRREITGRTVPQNMRRILTASRTLLGPAQQYSNTISGWNREIFGRFWLIRPEELPPAPTP